MGRFFVGVGEETTGQTQGRSVTEMNAECAEEMLGKERRGMRETAVDFSDHRGCL